MHLLDLTLDTLAENLALDEALLDEAEAGEHTAGVLRVWESPFYAVVLGRSSPAEVEVNLAACAQEQVSVLRRCSGGGTIVAGPGCLMYAVVLPYEIYPQLQAIDVCHQFVLRKMTQILNPLVPGVSVAGTSDLVLDSNSAAPRQKFSGNAMRSKRKHILYHGTLLYGFDLLRLGQLLAEPAREPAYRDGRGHAQFVTNLPLPRSTLVRALVEGWDAAKKLKTWPQARTGAMVQAKYRFDAKWVIHQPN